MTYSGISVVGGEPTEVTVENGVVVASLRVAGGTKTFVSPGFFDLQVNGYAGIDYSAPELDAAGISRLCRLLAASGTVMHLPTIVTNPEHVILRNLGIIAEARGKDSFVRDSIPGIHLEGPFIAPDDGPRGAHDRTYVRRPDFDEFLRWQDACGGLVKMVTVAPEVEGALSFIEKAAGTGVVVGIGHTGASPEMIRDAVSAGARYSTHLGNGCRAELPRLRNHIWEQLAADELTAGVISDGFHLPPAVVKTFARAKGRDRLVLVSDAAFIAGGEPGVYKWGNMQVELHPDGHLGLYGTPYLAGAGHLLDRCLAQFMNFTGEGVGGAVRLCTENPARLLGLPIGPFDLAPGTRAGVVLFDYEPGNEILKIRKVAAGNEVFTPA